MKIKTQHWLSPAMLRGYLNIAPSAKKLTAGEFARLINKARRGI